MLPDLCPADHNVGSTTLQDFVADYVATKGILPEGSSNLVVQPSVLELQEADGKAFSYLDTFVGRPTKTLTATNVTRAALAHPVQVRNRTAHVFWVWLLTFFGVCFWVFAWFVCFQI